jgi:hypothetical protein
MGVARARPMEPAKCRWCRYLGCTWPRYNTTVYRGDPRRTGTGYLGALVIIKGEPA